LGFTFKTNMKLCKYLYYKLNDHKWYKTKCDKNGKDLWNEIEIPSIKVLYSKKTSAQYNCCYLLWINNYEILYRTSGFALIIMMTIPVTTTSCERTFNKLKLLY